MLRTALMRTNSADTEIDGSAMTLTSWQNWLRHTRLWSDVFNMVSGTHSHSGMNSVPVVLLLMVNLLKLSQSYEFESDGVTASELLTIWQMHLLVDQSL